jgi:serine phosphatase RsbU (regulator of sigma subunit)
VGRITLLVLTLGLVVVGGSYVTWECRTWSALGWTGLEYSYEIQLRSLPEVGKRPSVGVIRRVHPWSPAQAAAIYAGERLHAINGIPIDDTGHLTVLSDKLRIGDVIRLALSTPDGKHVRDVSLRVGSPFTPGWVSTMAAKLGVALVFLVLGAVAGWQRVDDRRARLFFLLSLLFCGTLITWALPSMGMTSQRGLQPAWTNLAPADWVPAVLLLAMAALSGPLLLHFALIFPRPRPIVDRHPTIIAWIYAPVLFALAGCPIIIGALVLDRWLPHEGRMTLLGAGLSALLVAFGLAFLWPVLRARAEGPVWRRVVRRPLRVTVSAIALYTALESAVAGVVTLGFGARIAGVVTGLGIFLPMIPLALLLGIGYPIAVCVALARAYRDSGPEERLQVKWPVWGTFASSALSLAFTLGTFALGTWPSRGGLSPEVSVVLDVCGWAILALIPVSFAFGILKHRLMDIDIIIRKTVVWGIASVIIVVAYLAVVGIVGAVVVRHLDVKGDWVTIGCTLVLAALFVPLRNRVQTVADRYFFRERYSYPQLLESLAHEVSQATDTQHLRERFAERLSAALQNRTVVVFSQPANHMAYWASAGVGAPEGIIGRAKFETTSAVAKVVAGSCAPGALGLTAEETRTLRQIGCGLVVPMRWQDTLIGFVSIARKVSREDYDGEDRRFLEAAAAELARGIHRLRQRREEREGRDARDIQRALLPSAIAQIQGYQIACAWQPAAIVSGDYYDVIRFSERIVGLCIADVAGKGMPAALLMANLQASVKAFAGETVPPADLAARLNRTMCAHVTGGRFATFFYGLLDGATGRFTYVNAGHNPPILLRKDGTVVRLTTGGTGLGMFEGSEYPQGEATIGAGDQLLLYTDGVPEAMDAHDQEFGEARLADFLSEHRVDAPSTLLSDLIARVLEYSSGDLHDDVTLLCLQAEPDAAPRGAGRYSND